MTIDDALAKLPGEKWDIDGYYGLQCKDAIDAYVQFLFGVSFAQTIGAEDAKDAFDRASDQYFVKIRNNPNDPNQVPPRGAIPVLDGRAGGRAGHIFVVTGSNANGIDAIEQDGFKQVAAYNIHYTNTIYKYMIGWLVPRSEMITGAPMADPLIQVKQSQIDQWLHGEGGIDWLTGQLVTARARIAELEQNNQKPDLDSYSLGELLTAAFKKTLKIK